MQWYTLCRYNFYISCRYSGGNDILLSGGQRILCRLWFRWWYSDLSSRCRTAVGLYIRCLLCGSPLWCFDTRLPIEIMLLLSIDVFSFFFFLKTTVNGLRTTVGRSRLNCYRLYPKAVPLGYIWQTLSGSWLTTQSQSSVV